MHSPAMFIARCKACRAAGGGPQDIAMLVAQALASQPDWTAGELLYRADDLLVVDLSLPPFATSPIHEHGTWAVIGISSGCEVDRLYAERGTALVEQRELTLHPGHTAVLAADAIHAIVNPLSVPTRGLHVYGKDLTISRRRMWDPATGTAMAFETATFERWEQQLTDERRARDEGAG